MNGPKHPMQPVVRADDGIVRFKHNAIVQRLLDIVGARWRRK